MTAPIASGWSEIAGWALHPLESAAFSRRTPYGCHFENYLARRSFKMTTRPSDLPNFPYW
jgi:hypothetical protein